jgi:DNA gyrase/topoisomerase IV subunit B
MVARGAPQGITEHTDTIFQMAMRAIEKEDEDTVEVKLKVNKELARNLFGHTHAVHLRESDTHAAHLRESDTNDDHRR